MSLSLLVLLIFSFSAPLLAKQKSVLETTVKSKKKMKKAQKEVIQLQSTANAAFSSEQLLKLKGLQLQKEGGPFAATHIEIRGERAQRNKVSFFGITLNDPINGQVDLSMLPMDSGLSAELKTGAGSAMGGHLNFKLSDTRKSSARLSLLAGSLQSYALHGTLDIKHHTGRFFLYTNISSSKGDFQFNPRLLGQNTGTTELRLNNKQQREIALLYLEQKVPYIKRLSFSALLFSSKHLSGIPGFFSAPSNQLHQKKHLWLRSFRFNYQLMSAQYLSAQLSTQMLHKEDSHQIFEQQRKRSSLQTVQSTYQGRFEADFQPLYTFFPLLKFNLISQIKISDAQVRRQHLRRFSLALENTLNTTFHRSSLTLSTLNHYFNPKLTLFSGHIKISQKVNSKFKIAAQIAHFSRPPSLQELYAPSALITGNPDLRNETIDEVEINSTFNASSLLNLNLTIFAAKIDDSIQYVSRNAFEILPINTGKGEKAGFESSLQMSPLSWLTLKTNYRYLYSRLELSTLAIPGSSKHSLSSHIQIGHSQSFNMLFSFSYKSPAPVNLYARLLSPYYAKSDLQINLPIPMTSHLNASFFIHNIFDQKANQDLYLLPLPGRLYFFSLTLHS